MNSSLINKNYSPVAIGGIGGSGTRLIAGLLKEIGFYIGSDLNAANDNLWFTLLFKRKEILSVSNKEFKELLTIFLNGMTQGDNFTAAQINLINYLAVMDRPQHSTHWLKERARTLSATRHIPPYPERGWGWKEPNTHIIIDRLLKYLPNLKYIHVVRNGLDMAHSSNQNQLELWGSHFIGTDYKLLPYYSLRYWHEAHRRVLELCKPRGKLFLFLNYDEFCLNPRNGLIKLFEFLEINAPDSQISTLSNFVRIPQSIGRFKRHGIHLFDPKDVEFVRQLGFDTDAN